MADKIKNILKQFGQKPMLQCGIGCLLLFCTAFFVVYFTRVVYSPEWLGQINGTVVLGAIFVVIAVLTVAAKKISKDNYRSLLIPFQYR